MGLTEGNFPPVDTKTFMDKPYRERIRTLALHWVEYGFGAPKITTIVYIMKLLVLFGCGGLAASTLTSGISPFEPHVWWDAPIVYQKLVCWTMLLEAIGLAGSWGPLAGHFKPWTGGIRYWGRAGTIKLPPWPDKVPFTKGDVRQPIDAALYLAFLVSLAVCIALPTSGSHDLVPKAAFLGPIVLLVLLGLRDKIAFIAARSEQYLPALIFFAFFPFTDMIVAAKILMVSIWVGAAVSKFGRHFHNVIPPMVSNTPWLSSRKIKRMHYENFPDDLLPSHTGVRLAHVGGTLVEFVTPLVLLFSHNEKLTLAAVVLMICFHVFIISTFPLAVPLEWNLMFIFVVAFLFKGFPAQDGFGLEDMNGALLALTVVGVTFFPILGNLRPDLVSFLPSMRQYAGNWASAMWALAPGAEYKLNKHLVKPAEMQKDQLLTLYEPEEAPIVMEQTLGWRSMHSQARGLNSAMMTHLGEDIDTYRLLEAEFACNAIIGFNFGDGHLHDQRMIEAIQKRCQFEPGEFSVVWVESEAIANGRQYYWVMDAAVGVVERGSWSVKEATTTQPWLPDGPISLDVTWRLEGYERRRHPAIPYAQLYAEQAESGTEPESPVPA